MVGDVQLVRLGALEEPFTAEEWRGVMERCLAARRESCGLAFYRHQPHSHDDVQLSVTPAWVYGAVLHGEQITWIRQHGKLQVTVGPVFDPNVSFELDRTDYRHGISRNLTGPARTLVSLQRYVANGQPFFEAIVRTDEGPWSLIKRRFGSEVASIGLAVDG